MSRRRNAIRALAAAIAAAAFSAPTALAQPAQLDRSPDANGTVATQDVRSPDAKTGAAAAVVPLSVATQDVRAPKDMTPAITDAGTAGAQDLRSADAKVVGPAPAVPGPLGVGQPERTPDAVKPLPGPPAYPRYVQPLNAAPATPGGSDDVPWGIIAISIAGAGLAVGTGVALAKRTRLRTRSTGVAA